MGGEKGGGGGEGDEDDGFDHDLLFVALLLTN